MAHADYHAVRAKLVDLEEKYYPLEAECHRLLMQIVDARKTIATLGSGDVQYAIASHAVALHLADLEAQHKPLQIKAYHLWDQIGQFHVQLRIAIGRIYMTNNNTTNNTTTNNITNKRNHDEATSSTSSIEQVRRARVKVPRRVDSDDEVPSDCDSYPEVMATIVPVPDQLYCSKCDRELPSDMFSDVQRNKGQSGAGVAVCLQHAKTYARATEEIEVHNSDDESEAEEVSDDEEEIERRDRKEARRRVRPRAPRGIATTRPRRNPPPRDKWTYE